MSDAENFVARWSRLKRDTKKEKTVADSPGSPAEPDDAEAIAARQGSEDGLSVAGAEAEPAFDVTTLPSIESITASSDIRAFLQSGVPAELTKAALRRVWTTDPAIRDFIGIAENQWDFTDPTAMPGFGPLETTDNVRELVAQAMGKLGQVGGPNMEAPDLPEQSLASNSTAMGVSPKEGMPQATGIPAQNTPRSMEDPQGAVVEAQHTSADIAAQQCHEPTEEDNLPNPRAHGRALPQ